jgi:hypothetical protein
VLGPAAQAHRLQQLVRTPFPLRAWHAGEHHRQRHIVRGGHRGDEIERLKDDADVALTMKAERSARHLREIVAEDAERPFRRAVETGNQIQQRRLARPRRAEQADELALLDGHRHAVQRADGRFSHPVVFLQVAGLEQSGHGDRRRIVKHSAA